MPIYIYVCVYTYIHTYIYMYVCIYIFIFIVYLYYTDAADAYIVVKRHQIPLKKDILQFLYAYIHICVCIYIYTYIYICMYVYIYLYLLYIYTTPMLSIDVRLAWSQPVEPEHTTRTNRPRLTHTNLVTI
jgi:hypothetical protein